MLIIKKRVIGRPRHLPASMANIDFTSLARTEAHASTRIRLLGMAHLNKGHTYREVAQLLEVPLTTVQGLVDHYTELNPVEQVWQQLRDHYWANRCFKDYDDIVTRCCEAWNSFVSQLDVIRRLCSRQWAVLS